MQRMIGGETQADGVEVNYLFPTPFFLRATLGGYNKIGEDNDQVSNSKPRSWSQFTYLGRLNSYFDLTENHSIEVGTSMAYTPVVRLTGAPSGGNRILNGVDLTYRYQPLSSAVYQGLTWGSEFYFNSQRFPTDDSANRSQTYGGYSYAELKLNKNWSTGFQVDYAPIVDTPAQRTMNSVTSLSCSMPVLARARHYFSISCQRYLRFWGRSSHS